MNISRTGILFDAGRDIPLQTSLEMRVSFPPSTKMVLNCRGPVVRKQTLSGSGTTRIIATGIHACCLRHDKRNERFSVGTDLALE